MRGYALRLLKHYDEAITAYDQAIQINSQSWEAWHDRGIPLEILQQYENALASYQKAVFIVIPNSV